MTTADTLLAHIIRTSDHSCWLWTGAVNNKGYAQVGDQGRTRSAHRVSFEVFTGPIPDGMQVDHTCHNDSNCAGGPSCKHRRCINPRHLEAVTQSVNQLRAGRDECRNGHAYTAENTQIRSDTGRRVCVTCRRTASAKRNKGYGKRGRPSQADAAALAARRLDDAS